MNKVILTGRLTRDPDVRYSQGEKQTCVARFTLAVQRTFKRDGEADADFINCVAFGKRAEAIEKYVRQGHRFGVAGRIQTGSYVNKEGNKIYTTDVMVEEIDFLQPKGDAGAQQEKPAPTPGPDGFMNIPDGIDEELPFS